MKKGHPCFRQSRGGLCVPLVLAGLIAVSGCTKSEPSQTSQTSETPQAPPAAVPKPLTKNESPAAKQTLSKLEIKPLGSALFVGDSRTLSIQARDENNQERSGIAITWISENPSIVAVNSRGTVTAIAPGTASVTALSQGISDSIEIDVQSLPVVKLEIQPSAVSLSTGNTQQLRMIATDPMNRPITGPPVLWKSKSPAIASVDQSGLVRAKAPGTATIVATVKNKTAVVQVTVSRPSPKNLKDVPH